MITNEQIEQFFTSYSAALLARDTERIADGYGVPSLIVFPDNLIVVESRQQTSDFFAASLGQYDGVHEAEPRTAVIARSAASAWVDVTWRYDGQERERFCYQLAPTDGERLQIVVLTPLELGSEQAS